MYDSGAITGSRTRSRSATSAIDENILLSLELPAVARRKVSVAFDGGGLSSNAGVLLLREVERSLGIAARLAACLTDRRDAARVNHTVVEMLRLRMRFMTAAYAAMRAESAALACRRFAIGCFASTGVARTL